MRYAVLGALEVRADGVPVDVVRPRRRAVLAFLLLHANHPVRTEQLVDALWGEAPPRTARAQVHTAVSALRSGLPPSMAAALRSEGAGYRLVVADGDLDVTEFRRRIAAARGLDGGADDAEAVRLLRSAVGLWRGDPLTGVDAPFVDAARARLEEEWFGCHELLADLEMRRGRHAQLVPELTALLGAYPSRESLAERLTLALYRSGRTIDALAVVRGLRDLLAAEYGLDLPPGLVRLESAVLRGDPSLAYAPPVPGKAADAGPDAPAGRTGPAPSAGTPRPADRRPHPAQLPRRPVGFVGRDAELARLNRLLESQAGPGAEPPRIALVSGPAGVGKTALALRWAHAWADAFPDGQLFVDLHGYDEEDSEHPGRVLDRFLTALGVPGHLIPADLAQREDLYRSQVADRRLLLVLDNARDYRQIHSLLPGSEHCRTVVTSRGRMGELIARTGALPVPVGVLPLAESVAVLAGIAGTERVAEAPDAAGDLARLCGGLPLALRISAVRLVEEPHIPLADVAAELAPEENRLAGLELPDSDHTVTRALDHTRRRLTSAQARLFHLLCLHPGGSLGSAAAEALAGSGELLGAATPALRRSLRALQAVHLLDQVAPDRYALHDLVRLYGQQVSVVAPEDSARALARMADWYIDVAAAGQRLLDPKGPELPVDVAHRLSGPPPFGGQQGAVEWFDREADTLTALIRRSAAEGEDRVACRLACQVTAYLKQRHKLDALVETQELGERSALRLGEELVSAACANNLAIAYSMRRDPRAREPYRRANAIYLRHGERQRAAHVRLNLGSLHYELGRLAEAAEIQQEAIDALREFGRSDLLAAALSNLGLTRTDLGEHEEAGRLLAEAVAVAEEHGSPIRLANTLSAWGHVLLRLGDLDHGLAVSERALDEARRIGASLLTGRTVDQIGLGLAALGRWGEARDAWSESVRILGAVDSPEADVVRARLRGEPDALPRTGADGRPSLAELPSR